MVTARHVAVATPAASMTSLANALEPSSRADLARRAEGGDAARGEQVDQAVDERRLGPHDDEVDGLALGRRGHAGHVGDARRRARGRRAAMPGLPGAHSTSGSCGERPSARTIACSRPPEPTTRTFTLAQRLAMNSSTGMAESVS